MSQEFLLCNFDLQLSFYLVNIFFVRTSFSDTYTLFSLRRRPYFVIKQSKRQNLIVLLYGMGLEPKPIQSIFHPNFVFPYFSGSFKPLSKRLLPPEFCSLCCLRGFLFDHEGGGSTSSEISVKFC